MQARVRLELSRAADADLVGILDFGTERFGWDGAEAYVASFDRSFALMLDHPLIGAVYPDILPPIRSLAHGSHRIFYDVTESMILVQRILHKSVDVQRWLRQ
jgi:toxin ParE1/3/4